MPSSYIPRKMLPIRHGRKGQAQETAGSLLKGNGQSCSCHFQPLRNALSEKTKPPRMHDNSTCTQHKQRKNSRLNTRRPKRVQGTTTLACQCGKRRGTRYRFSPSQFLFSSWTRFAFLRSLSRLLRCIAPHSQSCSLDLCAVHALWKVRISIVWFHLQQFFVQARASMPVDLPAFNILDSCHKNRSSHPSPQSLPKSKPPPKWAQDSFFHHSGSSPLLSTCRHVRVSAVDVHVVLIGFFF